MTFWQSRILTVLLIGLMTAFTIHIVNGTFERARLDMTGDDLYSLSEGSEEIVERMRQEGVQPVDITLYFSDTTGKTLPRFVKDFISYERYLRALLREYERAAKGKIRLEFIDPVPDSDAAQDAIDLGLDGKMINQEGDLFFFGLAFETQTGSRDAIEFLWPTQQEAAEYEITKKLSRLLWPSSQRVGVLSSLEVFGSAQDPYMAQMLAAQGRAPTQEWISLQLLRESYEVEQIDADTDSISVDDYDLVVVIHPKNLPLRTLWALDEWIVKGGNTLVFLDPYTLVDRPPQNPQQPWAALQYRPASHLPALLDAWGLDLPGDEYAADFNLAVRRPVTARGAAEAVIIDLQIDENSREETLDLSHPILQGLSNVRFLLAGALVPLGGDEEQGPASEAEAGEGESETVEAAAAVEATSTEGLTTTPFITTTAAGNTIRVIPGFGGGAELSFTDFNDPAKLRDRFTPGTEPVALAYLIQGRVPSAFPEGVEFADREAERPEGLPPDIQLPPPEDAEIVRQEPIPEAERGEGAVLVFSDVDFISDALAFIQNPLGMVQVANDNHKVLLNSVDYLLGADALMKVRSRRSLRRPFTRFDEIEAEAEKETLEREKSIRADVESFQEELRDKQNEITQRNAALFQKRLQDEVDGLNAKIQEGNSELREIRKSRRQALEREEDKVRFAVTAWMPIVVLGVGIFLAVRRRNRERRGVGS